MTDKKYSELKVRSRAWMMTLFKHDWNESSIDDVMKSHNWSWCGQLESGHETHNEHYQLYVEAKNAIFGSSLSNAFGKAHVEHRRGTRVEAFEYCIKDDTRVDGPYFHGIDAASVAAGGQGKRNDLEYVRDLVKDGITYKDLLLNGDGSVQRVLAAHGQYVRDLVYAYQSELASNKRDVRVSYVYGAPGVGKTSTVLDMYPDAYRVKSYEHAFDSYEGQSTLILDEFAGQINFHELMNMLDVYPYECEARFRNRWALWSRVIIISNLPPKQYCLYPTVDSEKWPGFTRRINAGVYDFDNPDEIAMFKQGVIPNSILNKIV